MVEHRNILRLVTESDVVSTLPQTVRMAYMTNIAFDVSIWEILSTLLNGGTLVCVDYMTSLDSKALTALFANEHINTAMLTPPMLKHWLDTTPAALAGLDVIFVGGDRLHRREAAEAAALVQAGVYNAYGPTENGVQSTMYRVNKEENYVNGVPIGRAVSNSGAVIMDLQQQLVPLGVMGELIVTGDGVARGYTNPALDKDRFIQVTINNRSVRAYRTGDRARFRPDGQIEFFGRIDQQIKIRGHRIEPAEVEHTILGASSVRDVAVVVRKQEGDEAELVGFVTARDDEDTNRGEASITVEDWTTHFETVAYADVQHIDRSTVGNDFLGWTSMYDRREIDKGQMQEWLDDTIQTLLDGQAAGRVLEIGTGTGMVLFNLGGGLQSYVGIEPSNSAAAFVNSLISSEPALKGRAKVHVGTAIDADKFGELQRDLIVLNSVVQYFPSVEYLSEVVEALVRIPGVRRIFFGDIRSYALNKDFLTSRALHELGNRATRDQIRRKAAEIEERDQELLVDPAFFTRLTSRLAGRIKHVEILPKRMEATNELSAYRYAAVVHLNSPQDQSRPIYEISPETWVNFREAKLNLLALRGLLRDSPKVTSVAISNIPYKKTILERLINTSLDGGDDAQDQDTRDGEAWVSAVRSEAASCPSLSAIDLVQLGKETGFRVEISWARQHSQNGGLDAVFHRYLPAQEGDRVWIQFPTDHDQPSRPLTNRPLQQLQSRKVEGHVRDYLQALLPTYMMPTRIIVLDRMPVNANGKVDRRELTRLAQTAPRSKDSHKTDATPRNEMEVALCEEFADILGIEVGITDSFFELGGHSLLATKLAARLSRRLDTQVSVRDVFDHPVLADLAVTIQQGSMKHNPIHPTEYSGPIEQSFAQGRL